MSAARVPRAEVLTWLATVPSAAAYLDSHRPAGDTPAAWAAHLADLRRAWEMLEAPLPSTRRRRNKLARAARTILEDGAGVIGDPRRPLERMWLEVAAEPESLLGNNPWVSALARLEDERSRLAFAVQAHRLKLLLRPLPGRQVLAAALVWGVERTAAAPRRPNLVARWEKLSMRTAELAETTLQAMHSNYQRAVRGGLQASPDMVPPWLQLWNLARAFAAVRQDLERPADPAEQGHVAAKTAPRRPATSRGH